MMMLLVCAETHIFEGLDDPLFNTIMLTMMLKAVKIISIKIHFDSETSRRTSAVKLS
jgi:hypothetical protein